MGKEDKIIQMPKTNMVNKFSIMLTYKRLSETMNENCSYIAELSSDDLENIEKVFRAAAIISGLGMRSGVQYATAVEEIEALIGVQDYPVEMYRLFAKAYSDLLKYNSNAQAYEVSHKLA